MTILSHPDTQYHAFGLKFVCYLGYRTAGNTNLISHFRSGHIRVLSDHIYDHL